MKKLVDVGELLMLPMSYHPYELSSRAGVAHHGSSSEFMLKGSSRLNQLVVDETDGVGTGLVIAKMDRHSFDLRVPKCSYLKVLLGGMLFFVREVDAVPYTMENAGFLTKTHRQ